MNSNQSLVYFDPFNIEVAEEYAMADVMSQSILFSPVKVLRVMYQGNRYYCYVIVPAEGGQPRIVSPFFPSVTTITKHGKHVDINLLKWYADNGWENVMRILWHKRRYGTFLHIVQAELASKIMEHGHDVDLAVGDLRSAFVQYAHNSGLPQSWIHQHWDKLCKSLISWRLFCQKYEVEFLLIEKTLINAADGYAGTVDYVLRFIDGPRHARKTTKAQKYDLKSREEAEHYLGVLDVKSGTSGMHADGVMQLDLLARAVEENFEVQVQRLLHWNPTDWRTSPGFNLEDATEHTERQNVSSVLSIAQNRLQPIDDKPYKKTVSGWLNGNGGLHRKTLSVREALEYYVDGRAVELGMENDKELQAELGAMEALRNTFVTKATTV